MGDDTETGSRGGREIRQTELQDGDVLAFHASSPGGPAIRVRALRPSSHPEPADAVEALHREALLRHGVTGMVSMPSPLRTMSATWLLVAQAPGGDDCVAGIRVDLRQPA